MRKNVLMGMFAAATMLFATSCQKEELGTEVPVSFSLTQPGIATKAYSDGTTATSLSYAVYVSGSTEPVTFVDDATTFTDKTATVPLRLVTGQTYDILFWADAGATSPYTFNRDGSVSVSYEGALSQEETRDAFFFKKTLTVEGASTQTITLKRPFAQLNIGTTDAEEASVTAYAPTKSEVTVTNIYNTLNLLNETVSNPATVTFAMNDIPGQEETFPTIEGVSSVKYLSMNYLLVDTEQDQALVDIVFTISNSANQKIERNYTNVPAKRNYRTNIYGKLLTDPAAFDIIIDPAYDDNINHGVWDGETVTEPASTSTEWIVSTPAEWVWLKQNGPQGKNIKLDADIDFGGYEIKGLGFTGTFDGQGHTMSNMTLLCGGSYYSNGLFQGDASGDVTVQNVTIENVTAECSNPDQGYVGTIFGDIQDHTVTLNGVNVVNTNLCGVQSVGGLVGFVGSSATLNIENCTVDGSALSNYAVEDESGFVAGLVGRPVGTVNVTNSTVTNTTIDAYYAPRRGEASIQPVVGNNTTLTAGSDVVVTKTSLENAVFATSSTDLNDLTDGALVFLAEGTYVLPTAAKDKTLTFQGTGDATKTIIDCGNGSNYLNQSTVTFENLTIKTNNGNYQGFTHITNAIYINCIIKNQYTLYGPSSFTGCTFEVAGDAYNVWTYGTNSTFTGCTFNCDGKAVLVYNEGDVTDEVIFNNCKFNDLGGLANETKAAIELAESANGNLSNHTARINNCIVNGFSVTGQNSSTFGGTDLGTNIWGNKNLIPADRLDVFINGTEVY